MRCDINMCDAARGLITDGSSLYSTPHVHSLYGMRELPNLVEVHIILRKNLEAQAENEV